MILLGPLVLFVFIELIRSSMSSGSVGEQVLIYAEGRDLCIFDLTIFVYFFSNTCKDVIEMVGNFVSTSYYLDIN